MRKSVIVMMSLAPCLMNFAAAADKLTGSWRVQSIAAAPAFDSSKTRFDVAEDGRVSSTVGCNSIFGKPEIDGARIGFGAMAATRRACIGPSADLESRYLAALNNVQTYRVDGATLTLLDAAGVPVVILARTRGGTGAVGYVPYDGLHWIGDTLQRTLRVPLAAQFLGD